MKGKGGIELVSVSGRGSGIDRERSLGANVNVLLWGNINARVGNEKVQVVVDTHDIPGNKENGEKIIWMCVEREMVGGNTLF